MADRSRLGIFAGIAAALVLVAGSALAGTGPGTGADDRIRGTAAGETIGGGAGDDWIHGRAGDDQIIGGAGSDTLAGGAGRDYVNGGAGNDTIRTRDGEPDAVVCGKGRDTVRADADDVVSSDCEVETGSGDSAASFRLAIVITGGTPGRGFSAGNVVSVTNLSVHPGTTAYCLLSEQDNPNYNLPPGYPLDPTPWQIQPCTFTFDQPTQVQITASGINVFQPDAFDWAGDCAAAGESSLCRLLVDGEKVVTAAYHA